MFVFTSKKKKKKIKKRKNKRITSCSKNSLEKFASRLRVPIATKNLSIGHYKRYFEIKQNKRDQKPETRKINFNATVLFDDSLEKEMMESVKLKDLEIRDIPLTPVLQAAWAKNLRNRFAIC